MRKDNFFIFKIHGDIDRPETIILGSREYSKLLFRTPEYLSFLETLFATHTVLFIGFGGSDPDLDYTLDRLSTIFSRTLDKHFILLPSTKFNLTERRRLLLDRRLEVIEYKTDESHSEVDKFLNDLYKITNQDNKHLQEDSDKVSRNVLIICSQLDEKIQEKVSKYIHESGHQYMGWLFSEAFEERLIHKHFKGTQIGLVLITENSVKSENFQRELEYVILREIEEKIKLVVVVVGDVEIPKAVMNKLFIKISSLNSESFRKIVQAINRN